jgi:hypothetical protein
MIHSIKGLFNIQKDCAEITIYVQFKCNALQKIAIGCFGRMVTSDSKLHLMYEVTLNEVISQMISHPSFRYTL